MKTPTHRWSKLLCGHRVHHRIGDEPGDPCLRCADEKLAAALADFTSTEAVAKLDAHEAFILRGFQ